MTFVNAGSNFVVSLTLLNYGEMYINTSVLALLSLWMKSYGVIVQMKATEQYFPVVPFIMLHKVAITFVSVDKTYGVTISKN